MNNALQAIPPKLPCPCCGGEAWHYNYAGEAVVECRSCGLTMIKDHEVSRESDGVLRAVLAWNHRHV